MFASYSCHKDITMYEKRVQHPMRCAQHRNLFLLFVVVHAVCLRCDPVWRTSSKGRVVRPFVTLVSNNGGLEWAECGCMESMGECMSTAGNNVENERTQLTFTPKAVD